MKKVVLLIIIFTGLFIASCVMDSVFYCPYCSRTGVTEVSEGVYKCGNANCGKTFGAKEIVEKAD